MGEAVRCSDDTSMRNVCATRYTNRKDLVKSLNYMLSNLHCFISVRFVVSCRRIEAVWSSERPSSVQNPSGDSSRARVDFLRTEAGTQYHRVPQLVLLHPPAFAVWHHIVLFLIAQSFNVSPAPSERSMQEEEPGRRAIPVSTNTTYPHPSGHQ